MRDLEQARVERRGRECCAEDLGVVASAVVPVVALAVVTASALVVTLLVAAVPAGIAARTRPAALLRSE